jgi:hypothetical protein
MGAWIMALLGWLIPGLGHLTQGRTLKGIIGGASIIAIFILGAAIGGHIYSVPDTSEGLLSVLFSLCDVGSGAIYFFARVAGIALGDQPQRATAEYGSIFLMVAGLLNFILALDAFDIGVGRKS